MSPAPHLRWLVQHQRTGCWLAEDHTEPHGRTWVDAPLQALMAVDPEAFAVRLREALPLQLLEACRLVPVVFCAMDNSFWWQVDA